MQWRSRYWLYLSDGLHWHGRRRGGRFEAAVPTRGGGGVAGADLEDVLHVRGLLALDDAAQHVLVHVFETIDEHGDGHGVGAWTAELRVQSEAGVLAQAQAVAVLHDERGAAGVGLDVLAQGAARAL